MKIIKYGFVILHYLAYDMTTLCVNTILDKFINEDIYVVIVDNASSNGSGIKLQNYYLEDNRVNVIINKDNVGFAKGNNIGYEYLKECFSPDYVIIMNNDVIISQDDFLQKIDDIYSKHLFDVLGPDVFCPSSRRHQNPVSLVSEFDYYSLKRQVVHLQRLHNNFSLFYFLDRIKGTIVYHYRKLTSHAIKRELYREVQQGVLLHGSCYIFSSSFFKKRNYPFNPSTFLYFEEEILYFEAIRDELVMVYSPDIKVEHLEDVSTNLAFSTDKSKTKMKTAAQLKSSKILLELYEEYAKKHGIRGNYKIGETSYENIIKE